MNQFRTVSTIVFGLLGVGLGFLMFGWWAALIVVGAIAWQLAAHRTRPVQAAPIRHQPAASQSQPIQSVTEAPTRVIADVSTPNRDPRPWQERVEEIERNRVPMIVMLSGIQTFTSPNDERIAALNRQATVHKDSGHLDAAVACLKEAHSLMKQSGTTHTPQAWCRLPLYLQHAGRFDESMAVFDQLLVELPDMARRATGIGNKNMGPAKGKRARYNHMVAGYTEVYLAKRALVASRHNKSLPPKPDLSVGA